MFSAKEATIAADVARKTELPIAVNMTYKCTKDRKTGKITYKTDWGHSATNLLQILNSGEFSNGDSLIDNIDIIGLNCGAETKHREHSGMPYAINGTKQLHDAFITLGINEKRMMAYPNAGMPELNENYETVYTQHADEMKAYIPELIAAGAYIIGGCCGTTPKHIKAFRQVIDTNT